MKLIRLSGRGSGAPAWPIGTAESLSQSSEGNKKNSPHFRKAHFRYLGSDSFTNKKGQIVLVQETIVNGKAKTIHTASDLSKMKS